jgi:uncharacterized membrane protein YbhN (UPF0104 family)
MICPLIVCPGLFGAVALVSASMVTMVRKRVARKLYAEVGKPKRVLAVSIALASVLLLPFAMHALYVDYERLPPLDTSLLLLLAPLVLFTVFVDYYVVGELYLVCRCARHSHGPS